jgi:RNA polymerase sigma factor (sigma-70 family)
MARPAHAKLAKGELDDDALRRAQRGDERAWRELVTCYQDAVHALVWRLCIGRARHRVDDLVQETFVRVLRALPRFDPDGPATLRTWMLTIATRLTLNELRRPDMASLSDLPEAPAPAGAPLQPVERRRLGERIARAMAELPSYQRAVVVLREIYGFEYAEVASALDLDIGTVKSRLGRARLALRAALADAHPA